MECAARAGGWFVKVSGFSDDFLALEAELRKIRLPAIIDHIGGPDYRRGTTAPVCGARRSASAERRDSKI